MIVSPCIVNATKMGMFQFVEQNSNCFSCISKICTARTVVQTLASSWIIFNDDAATEKMLVFTRKNIVPGESFNFINYPIRKGKVTAVIFYFWNEV
jgi:hypothetical protein